MTRKEIEARMLDIGRELNTMVKAYDPGANYIRISVLNGACVVSAANYDELHGFTGNNILEAFEFTDGGRYYPADDEATA